jgi:hypothetical protein
VIRILHHVVSRHLRHFMTQDVAPGRGEQPEYRIDHHDEALL